MKRFIFIIVATALFVSCETKQKTETPHISFFIGSVTRNGEAVSIKETITDGDVIITTAQSSCDIRVGSSMIRVKENSRLVITRAIISSSEEKTDLALESGKILCKPKKLLDSDSFTVRTPTAVAAVRGTQFSVTTDSLNTTQIKVFDGKVKVARRVASLDDKLDKVMDQATSIQKEETAVISADDAAKATDAVNKALDSGKALDATIAAAPLGVPTDQVNTFKPSDFVDEKEIIEIKPKEEAVIEKIIKETKKPSGGAGRLLVTRYEAYVIVNGTIQWEAKLTESPIKSSTAVYIAAGDRVIAARSDGKIIWNVALSNNGKIRLQGKDIFVSTTAGEKRVSSSTGRVY
ncbi:MAG: FecR domain-containing protein [Spirochaetes bacterium]|jgi:hypothetical protein|nr:FecR domain-containing protein [Spirochaetota bacterium]